MTTVPSAASSRPGSTLDAMLLFTIPFTVIAWASSFPAIRAGLAGFGALELAALRFAIAGVFAALFLIVTRPKLPERADIWRFLTGGIVFIALYAIFLNLGQRVVPAGAASFIINTNPIMTAALAMLVLNERFSALAWAGTALAFAGIGVIAVGNGLDLNIGVSVLLIIYPLLPLPRIVAADIAYAVPLTLVAGLGHASLGSVDWPLLALLLAGSLPGIWVGTHLIHRINERVVRSILSVLLAWAGLKLIAI